MLKVLEKILTIIIPVYNQERYLDECLENIAMENNEKIEIILINDGSVDNSIKIMKKYAKKNNKIRIISIQNRGCSFVRNLGITLATGKYIWFIDSDDFIEKNSIIAKPYNAYKEVDYTKFIKVLTNDKAGPAVVF